MTDHAITHGSAIPDRTVREEVVAEPAPREEAEAGPVVEAVAPDYSAQTLAAASLFIIPLVTFILIVTMWYRVGGF